MLILVLNTFIILHRVGAAMQPVLIGYLPKRTARTPAWLDAPHVAEICSASWCISRTPDDCFVNDCLNDMSLFDSETAAWDTVPASDRNQFDLYAFALFQKMFDEAGGRSLPLPNLSVEPLPVGFLSLGYDAVSNSGWSGPIGRGPNSVCFECSPLSCNSMAKTMSVNQHCLLNSRQDACLAARQFARGKVEPGPYVVVEVFRKVSG
jgi:hypothetical protein